MISLVNIYLAYLNLKQKKERKKRKKVHPIHQGISTLWVLGVPRTALVALHIYSFISHNLMR